MREWYPPSRVSGPLAGHAEEFADWLRAQGFSVSALSSRMWQFDRLSGWLERERLAPGELTAERAQQFVVIDRATRIRDWKAPRTLRLPLAYLREAGLVPAPVRSWGPVDLLLDGFGDYLARERGLTAKTVNEYHRVVRPFLAADERDGLVAVEALTAADVTAFLVRECARRSVSEAQQLTKGLRALLRYLHVAGMLETPLAWAVPGVADLRGQPLPRGLDPAEVAALLASCDRTRVVGARDYALLLVLSRLGLRAAEAAGMELEDLDWHAGELVVRGKGRRNERLPLPVDVGEALVGYLERRPQVASRAVFVRHTSPRGPLSPPAVSGVVRAACTRAGLPLVCAHRLRHTAATEMLKAVRVMVSLGPSAMARSGPTSSLVDVVLDVA
jgi:integrase/recombinase XerD